MNLNADIVLDNPILIKHIRSRLRAKQLIPMASIVAILCLCIVWLGQARIVLSGIALSMLLGLQVVLLVFIGAAQVGTAVAKVRESGIIDFHRVSPLPTSWLTVGFVLGPPILQYLLFAVTLPFAAWLANLSPIGIPGVVRLIVALMLLAWVIHATALVSSLAARKPKGSTRAGVAVVVILALFLSQPLGFGVWFAVNRLGSPKAPFFGVELDWLLFITIFAVSFLGMLLVAATRKLRSDRMHAFSKPQAIACQALVSVLMLGALWQLTWDQRVLVVLYVLIASAMFLTITITPDRTEYVKGLRRAIRMGQRRPSLWSDAGIIRLPLFILCGIAFLAVTGILQLTVDNPQIRAKCSLALAIGVFVVAYFGLSLQYLLLRMPKYGSGSMAFFIFLVWVVPILVGSVAFGVGTNPDFSKFMLAVSPVTGIAMSSGLLDESIADSARAAAVVPAITFAVLFNYLVIAVRRKIDISVRSAAQKMVADRSAIIAP